MVNEFYISLLSNNSVDKYQKNTLSCFTNKLARPIELTGDDDWYVGLCEIECNKFKNAKPMHLVCMYTDFIKPQCIGDTITRYLRVIPMKNALNNPQNIQLRPIQYCPVDQKYIENITILLVDMQGNKIEFHESEIPTYILLHFKRL